VLQDESALEAKGGEEIRNRLFLVNFPCWGESPVSGPGMSGSHHRGKEGDEWCVGLSFTLKKGGGGSQPCKDVGVVMGPAKFRAKSGKALQNQVRNPKEKERFRVLELTRDRGKERGERKNFKCEGGKGITKRRGGDFFQNHTMINQ